MPASRKWTATHAKFTVSWWRRCYSLIRTPLGVGHLSGMAQGPKFKIVLPERFVPWPIEGKGKGLNTCYSVFYMSQTRDRQRVTILEVTADWQEPVVPQRQWTTYVSPYKANTSANWNLVSRQIWRGCHSSVDSGDLNQAPPKQSAVCATCIIPALPVNCQFIWMACAFGMSATQPILGWL